ncbi:tyrosine-type recombinase/integrase [Xanthomonas nasturtii]|uniref:tyrosine-type recombinase/integrase n=1 Tax=Xanthomonas TaxID=338 RepID=UPI002B22AC9A|nr:tyrosine-type recombinase/integrase [Xanthomonas nasturtii]MEA9557608.1 tyrosine-type recombinase/integrase [Xanthomonas nasturtii]
MKSNMVVPNPPASAILAPDRLAAQAADAVRELLAEAAAANTTRSYATALRYWAGWFQGRFGQPITLPVPEPAVVQFVVDHLARRGKAGLTWELPPELDAHLVAAGLKQKSGAFKLSTVVHRVAVLSAAHQAHKAANPCEAPAVRQLLKRGRRASVKRGERPHKKTAITRDELEALLSACDDSLEGLRDKALLLFGFASGGRRRSEIAAADWQDLRRIGDDAFIYRLEHSKTQQAGPNATATPDKPVLGRAGSALATWLTAADITEGPLFRRLWGERVGPALSPKAVAAIVQRRALQAGLTGDFGGHSLRSGFITEGGRQGIALPALMALTEHRSVPQAIGYFQAGEASSNPAARLLDL